MGAITYFEEGILAFDFIGFCLLHDIYLLQNTFISYSFDMLSQLLTGGDLDNSKIVSYFIYDLECIAILHFYVDTLILKG